MDTHVCRKGCCTLKVKPYLRVNDPAEKYRRKRNKAGVFVYDPQKRKVLLVQSRGHLWGPPKGTLEFHESNVHCAIRELQEETGIDIGVDSLLRATNIKNRAMYYYAEIPERELEIQESVGNDANGIGWVNLDCLGSFIADGNISVTQHCRFVAQRFLDHTIPYSNFILVDSKQKTRF